MTQASSTRLFLVGPMGAGKSTLGRHLARLLDWPFHDADRVIEQRCGADIPWIFDVEGEEGFRQREEAIIDELTLLPRVVLATGGGVVKRERNRRNLRERGTVVYLWTPVDVQYERTRHDRNRPLLQNPDPEGTLRALHDERDPLYREIAHHVVSTASGNLRQVAEEVLACLDAEVSG